MHRRTDEETDKWDSRQVSVYGYVHVGMNNVHSYAELALRAALSFVVRTPGKWVSRFVQGTDLGTVCLTTA